MILMGNPVTLASANTSEFLFSTVHNIFNILLKYSNSIASSFIICNNQNRVDYSGNCGTEKVQKTLKLFRLYVK